jgi:tetratricopeptide (TPR) repeat protein/ADP-heptose:LPS heptosyltransferase
MTGRQARAEDAPSIIEQALHHQRAGRLEQACVLYAQALQANPQLLDALNNWGVLLNSMGRHAEALAVFERQVAQAPDHARSHANCGVALRALGRLDDALKAYQAAIRCDAKFHPAYNNLGNLLYTQGQFADALQQFETACRLSPEALDYRFMLAKCLLELQQIERAQAELQVVLASKPDDADAWGTLARLWSERHAMPEALHCFERGLEVRPDYAGLRYNRGLARLLAGDLVGGFADYEYRFDVPDFPSKRIKSSKPIWAGEDISGKTLLIHAEQGLGDTLQFLRYIPRLPPSIGRVLLLIQETLTELVVLPDKVQLVHEGQKLPDYDLVCPLLSLPHLLGIDPLSIPADIPYLRHDSQRSATWADYFTQRSQSNAGSSTNPTAQPASAPRLRIGLVWAGNPSHKNDANRSLELTALAPLIAQDGLDLYSFQVGARSADIAQAGWSERICDLSPQLKTFADTAAAVIHLDLLICVDTSIAHVAGALGVPVWLLLPWMPDWRWLLHREDSPWYPSMRLLRQSAYKDWAGVINTLSKDLKELSIPSSAAGKRRAAQADATIEQGRLLLERNQAALAEPAFWKALRETPTHARAASALAIAAFRQGKTQSAVVLGSRACRQNPQDPESWSNCGAYYKAVGDMSGALHCFERGLEVRPDYAGLRYNRGLARLLAGDLVGGFADYEYRFDVPDFPSKRIKSSKPIWAGEDISGKTLLIHAEQGLGDTLQFLRYIPRLPPSIGRVLLLIQETLTELVVLPDKVQLVHEGQKLPDYDLVCPLLSLPHLLGIDPLSIPADIPYLRHDSQRSATWADYFTQRSQSNAGSSTNPTAQPASAPRLRIGLVWAGNPSHKNDANRSLELTALAPLIAQDGLDLYSFQVGARSADIAQAGWSERICDLSPQLKTFADTAAAVIHLDLLICVDTSIAHVAGALGVPVWLLLPWMPDWRWLLHREDSPWYPSMRLLRQSAYKDWAGVINTLSKDLKELSIPSSAAGKRRAAQADATIEQGRLLLERNQAALAEPAFWKALRETPTHARAASALAIAAFRQGKTQSAVVLGSRACRQNPQDPESWSNCGAYYKASGDAATALRYQLRAVQLNPRSAQAQSNYSNTLGALGRWEEALAPADQAVALSPDVLEYAYNRGIALKENARFAEALAVFKDIQRRDPTHVRARLHQSLIELLTGDLPAGFITYETRWDQPDAKERRSFSQPQWAGQPLDGKTVLVHAEQGFGDSFQFLRYLPLLKAKGAQVVVVVQKDIESIVQRIPGCDVLVSSGAPLPLFDYHCPLLSLPRGFATTVATVPSQVPYLSAQEERVAAWRKRLGPAKTYRVGVVWAGRPTHGNDANRSLSLTMLQPLLQLRGVECIALQKGDAIAQAASLPSSAKLRTFDAEIQSFEDTAALLQCVDELVTVDTSVAHLAGGLGRQVRLLLPLIPDWRWLWDRADSPWYPSMHLYRQTLRGQWEQAIQSVVKDVVQAAPSAKRKRP